MQHRSWGWAHTKHDREVAHDPASCLQKRRGSRRRKSHALLEYWQVSCGQNWADWDWQVYVGKQDPATIQTDVEHLQQRIDGSGGNSGDIPKLEKYIIITVYDR
jgi:hypothetical protein